MSVRSLPPRPRRSLSSATCTVAVTRSTTSCAQLLWCLAGSAHFVSGFSDGHGLRDVVFLHELLSSACGWPSVVCLQMARGRVRMALGSQNGSSTDGPSPSTDGPWSSADDPWFPKRVVYGWLVVAYGWPVVVCGWPLVPKTGRLRMARGRLRMTLGSQNGSSTDGPTGARSWLLFVVQPRCKYRVIVLPVVVQRQVLPCGPWRFHSRRSWTTLLT